MQIGDHRLFVENYSHQKSKGGFSAQIELENKDLFEFSCNRPLRSKERVNVAMVNWNGDNLKITPHIELSTAMKNHWGINTTKFHKVNMMMLSPNFWDGQKAGNEHFFFVIDGCINPEKSRGFYNEFLRNGLTECRKAFEVLGSKMKTEKSENQLSGLGFSVTQKNHVFLKITGSFTRTIKVNF